MGMIDPIIEEFKHETASTRKLLERVPEDKADWKPHEKSMSMNHLASHIAESLGWLADVIQQDEFDMDPESYKPWMAGSRSELLETFDKNVRQSVEAMRGQTDDRMMATWTMKVGGNVVLSMPRIAVLRTFTISHMIHHRGQLGVYLRLNDIPVPQVYGPTADEPDMQMPQG